MKTKEKAVPERIAVRLSPQSRPLIERIIKSGVEISEFVNFCIEENGQKGISFFSQRLREMANNLENAA